MGIVEAERESPTLVVYIYIYIIYTNILLAKTSPMAKLVMKDRVIYSFPLVKEITKSNGKDVDIGKSEELGPLKQSSTRTNKVIEYKHCRPCLPNSYT